MYIVWALLIFISHFILAYRAHNYDAEFGRLVPKYPNPFVLL